MPELKDPDTKKPIEKLAEEAKKAIDEIPEPSDVAGKSPESLDPGSVKEDVSGVQTTVASTEPADPTDWKSQYDALSKQYAELQKKYSDRFTGTNVEPTALSTDAKESINLADDLASGDDIGFEDLFNDATEYGASRTKDVLNKSFSKTNEPGASQAPTIQENVGEKIGSSLRNAAVSLPQQAKEAYDAGEFSSPKKIASGLAGGIRNAVINNPVKLGFDELFEDKK